MSDLSGLSNEQLIALYQQGVANHAINQNESSGAPDNATGIVNPASGARGNMQVMPATAAQPGFGVKPSNGTPEDDARMGRDYRSALQQHYGDTETAAIAYNMGPAKTDNWIANGRQLSKLPDETLKYLYNYKNTVNAMPQVQQQPAPATVAPQAYGSADATPQVPSTPQSRVNAFLASLKTPDYTAMNQQGSTQAGLTARAIGHGIGDAAGAMTQGVTRLMGVPDVRNVINNAVDARTPAPQGAVQNAVQAIGSQVANPVNYMVPSGGVARSALGGALAAGMQPAAQGITPQQVAQQVALGGVTGGAMGGIGNAMQGATLRPAAQQLMDAGVTLTPGQAAGGLANSLEQKATSIPLVGEAIKSARSNAVQQFNQAIGDQVLAPIGDKAPKGVTGRAFVEQIGNKISDQYDQILPRLTFRIDPQMAQDMAPIMQQVQSLPSDTQNAFRNIWQRNFQSQMTPQGTMPGTVFKQADSVLGSEAANFKGSSDAFQRQLGGLLQDTQSVMRNSLQRTNPNEPALGPINQAWKNYTVLRNAGARVNNPEMPIQPGQFQAAVKAGDKSLQKGAFASGNANMQPLSDAGMSVLGNNVPDSGTAGRSALMGLPGAIGAVGGLAGTGHPLAAAGAALGGGAGLGLYGTPLGRQAMLAALARRPNAIRGLGGSFGLLAPAAGAGAARSLQDRTADQQ